VSTPRFLDLPPLTRATTLETRRGGFAALEATPPADAKRRGTTLLVPGFTGSKEDFIAVLGPLARAGHRVVAVDPRGQYETAGADDPLAYAVEALAADVAAMVATLGDGPVHLLGHSFGGLVARAAVIADSGLARSLTLLCSGPAALDGQQAQLLGMMAAALAEQPLTAVWEATQAFDRASGVPLVEDPRVAEFLRARFHANSVACLTAMCRTLVSEPDRVAELAAVPVPKLVMYGERDDRWPPSVQSAMAGRLGAREVIVAGAAHSPAAEAPERTAAELAEFWAGAERAGAASERADFA